LCRKRAFVPVDSSVSVCHLPGFLATVFVAFVLVVLRPVGSVAGVPEQLKEIASLEDVRGDAGVMAAFLEDPSETVRARAVLALARLQDSTSIPKLGGLRDDPSSQVRALAAFALGQMWSRSAAEYLLPFVSDRSRDVKLAAVEALGKTRNGDVVPVLSRVLKSRDRELASQAALSLVFIADSTALPVLWRASGARDEEMKWHVAYALENIPHSKSLKTLSSLAADESWVVRSYAARALGKIASKRSLSILGRQVTDEDWHVRVNTARSLASFPAEQSVPLLVTMLNDTSFHVREAACTSLGRIASETAAEFVRRLAFDRSPSVRAEAVRALALCCKDFTVDLIDLLLKENVWFVRAALFEAIGEAKMRGALPILQEAYIRESDPRVRAAAIVGIGKTRDSGALPILRQAWADSDFVVVVSVCDALGEIGEPGVIPTVLAIYEKWKDYPEPDVKLSVIETLKKFKAAGAMEIYRKELSDQDYRVREAAYGVFKELWGERLADSLRALSQSAIRPPTEVPATGSAAVVTEKGEIVIQLLGDDAPNTVHNFVSLVRKGYYDGFTFHRVVPNFVIQDGCPRGDGSGGPGYTIRCEINRRHYVPGAVGMALAGKDTGGSQFFITHSPQPHLDGRYTIFGQVVEGMDVVESIDRGDAITEIRLLDEP
jgi:cyclophilin family peptidyl-prolyl cis-trans isomerase/HEAT repeat protein